MKSARPTQRSSGCSRKKAKVRMIDRSCWFRQAPCKYAVFGASLLSQGWKYPFSVVPPARSGSNTKPEAASSSAGTAPVSSLGLWRSFKPQFEPFRSRATQTLKVKSKLKSQKVEKSCRAVEVLQDDVEKYRIRQLAERRRR